MRIEQYLKKNEQSELFAVDGSTINLKRGRRIKVVTSPQNYAYELDRGDQITLPNGEEFDGLTVTNLAGDEEIEIAYLYGQYTPTIDGSKLAISAEIQTDAMQVTFPERQPVELSPTQRVKADVNFPDEQTVKVSNQITIPDVQKVHVVKETQADTEFVAHETMTATGTITGNHNRQMIILKAADSNKETIWIGGFADKGFPLPPKAVVMWGVTAKIPVLIQGADDELLISEVV